MVKTQKSAKDVEIVPNSAVSLISSNKLRKRGVEWGSGQSAERASSLSADAAGCLHANSAAKNEQHDQTTVI